MNNLSSSSALAQKYKDYVEIKVDEIHGFGDASDLKPFDIKEGSEDRIINIYTNFFDKKDFKFSCDSYENGKRNFITETGLHVTIPEGYILYVFPDKEIYEKYNIELYHSKEQIFIGYCYPFNIVISCKLHKNNGKYHIKINNEQLIARACVIPFPKINVNSLEYRWENDNFSKCKKVLIKTNCGNCQCSGGSGYTKPTNTYNVNVNNKSDK